MPAPTYLTDGSQVWQLGALDTGAYNNTPVTGPTGLTSILLADTATGTIYALTANSDGSLKITASSGAASPNIPVTSAPSGALRQIVVTNGAIDTQPLSAVGDITLYLEAVTATFDTGFRTHYTARYFPVADPGPGNTQIYYVTIYDPDFLGETPGVISLTAFVEQTAAAAHVGEFGYIYMGAYLIAGVGAIGGEVSCGSIPPTTEPPTGSVLGGRPDAVIDIPSTSAPGNFSIAHGLAATPQLALVQMTSSGKIWLQSTRYDTTNVNLVASDAGLTGKILVYSVAPSAQAALAPTAPGDFTVAHGLGAMPAAVLIQMTSGGDVWFRAPGSDSANAYLDASDAGLTGYVIAWVPSTASTAIPRASVAFTASAPGNFSVPHGLGVVPTGGYIRMSVAGEVWFQPARYDATNIYLVASDAGLTGSVEVFA